VIDAGIDEAAVYAAVDRCWNIEWRENPARLESTMALIREYLRRSAVVAEAVGETPNWPWFDAAARLTLPGVDRRFLPAYVFLDAEPQYERPGVDPREDRVIALNQHMNEGSGRQSWYGRHSCWWYIRWAAIKNHPALAPLSLPDLYEPLIVLYERGGSFHPHHGDIDFFPNRVVQPGAPARWIAREPLPSLDWAALDEIDREDVTPGRKTL
jgi:hypothetical protein